MTGTAVSSDGVRRPPAADFPPARGFDALKRAIDGVVAAILLVPALPLIGLAALAVKLEDGGPAFFRQKRVGLGGREYEVVKLRSLRVNSLPPEQVGQVTTGHALVTRTGRIIRRLKIDELPQLLNVLRGDMSLVGPRPTIREQVERYDDFERRRLLVRPGLTGWAQVNGNTAISWRERIELDVWYVEHRSPSLDLRILLKTAVVVLLGERPNPRALARARAHANGTGRRGRDE